jgi:hypothetical protein
MASLDCIRRKPPPLKLVSLPFSFSPGFTEPKSLGAFVPKAHKEHPFLYYCDYQPICLHPACWAWKILEGPNFHILYLLTSSP